MSYYDNYYYNIIPFVIKSVDVTYQWPMDTVFAKLIGHNMEVYIDDMILKTWQWGNKTIYMEEDDPSDWFADGTIRKLGLYFHSSF